MFAAPLHHRALSLLIAALFALAPLAAALHASEHAHRFCAEHNAFEEASPTGEGASADADGLTITAAAEDDDSAHLRCALANAAPRAAIQRAEHVLLELPVPARNQLPEAITRSHPPIPHLLLAPKVSPPAFG